MGAGWAELAVVKDEPDLTTAIYIVRADGSGLRRLLRPYVPKSDRPWSIVAASETEPDWSPDGHELVVQAGDGQIVVVGVATARRREIANGGYEPAWSPDGRLIAFESDEGLWVANADGSGGLHLLAEHGRDPSLAPDSRRIVFEVRHWHGRFWRTPRSLSVVGASGIDLRTLSFGHSVEDDTGWQGGPPVLP